MRLLLVILLFSLNYLQKSDDRLHQIAVVDEQSCLSRSVKLPKKSIVFLAGFDQGDNTYYAQAKTYFQAKGYPVVESLYSLEEILNYLNQHQVVFDEIHIVSHSNPWRGMSMKVKPGGERVMEKSLRKAIAENTLPSISSSISNETKLIFHACGLGENENLVAALKTVFTTNTSPSIYASPLYSIFGDKFAPHYMAKAYYAYYPTAYTPGKNALAIALREAYPEQQINWMYALNTQKSLCQGGVYSYQYNVPIEWKFTFEQKTEIPILNTADEIIDWVVENDELMDALYAFRIPIEKFRWRSETKGHTLTIKGKTTIVCVLEPVMRPNDPTEYLLPDVANVELFTKK